MMETARDLFRNHCLIGQGIRRFVSNVLRGGFLLDPKTGDEDLDRYNAAWFREWAEDPEQCDLSGEHNFRAMERLVLEQVTVDGDMLTLPDVSGRLYMSEAHRLRTPTNTRKNVVHGVELDGFRRRIAYWVTKDDIDPLQSVSRVSDVTQYPARDKAGNRVVFHHYMPDRISQTRGITAFAPAIDTAGMGDDLMFAQLVKAQIASCVALFRELSENATMGVGGQDLDETTETRPTGSTRTLAGWQPGLEVFGFPGEKLNGFSPAIPNPEFFQHAMLILGIVAVNLDLPLAVLLLDPSKTNFSGWRGAMDQARQRFMDIQRWLSASFHSPVYRWQVRRRLEAGDATLISAQNAGINVYGHRWQAAGWPYIEPTQDATGDLIQERGLLNSRRRLAADRGIDYEDLVTEIVADRVRIIRESQRAADGLNTEFATSESWQALSWRDIAQWAMPEGVTLSSAQNPQPEATPDQSADGGDQNAE